MSSLPNSSVGHEAFVDALVTSDIEPDDAAGLALFGQFVGSWDLVVTEYEPDGSSTVLPGEWHFAWVLGGRAVADVWVFPARDTALDPIEHGMSIRFPEPDGDAWRSTWIGPRRGIVRPFIAHPTGDEIVLSGSFDPGVDTRWVFSDISSDAFRWRNEERPVGATTWDLKQTFDARRR